MSLPRPKLLSHEISSGDRLYSIMYHPHNFDQSRKYPVVLNIYGGPDFQLVTNTFKVSWILNYHCVSQHLHYYRSIQIVVVIFDRDFTYIVILGMTFIFFFCQFTFSNFYFDFYFPFSIGLLFPFSIPFLSVFSTLFQFFFHSFSILFFSFDRGHIYFGFLPNFFVYLRIWNIFGFLMGTPLIFEIRNAIIWRMSCLTYLSVKRNCKHSNGQICVMY